MKSRKTALGILVAALSLAARSAMAAKEIDKSNITKLEALNVTY